MTHITLCLGFTCLCFLLQIYSIILFTATFKRKSIYMLENILF
nr:MAG TPA: hypothetical protein [Caudoviricetes sp.]